MAEPLGQDVQADPRTVLFEGFKVAVLPSDKLSEDDKRQITEEITARKGEYVLLDYDDRINLSHVTHIISATSDFPQYFDALERLIPVVKPTWVFDGIKKGKTANPRQYSPDPALFMSNVCVYCADLPEGDKEAIYGGVMAMGGQFSSALSKVITHLVALDIRTAAVQTAMAKKLKCHIVLPHWFDTCFKLGVKVVEKPYLLADPVILTAGTKPPAESKASSATISGALSPTPVDTTIPTGPIRSVNVFKGKKLKISDQFDLGISLMEAIATVVEKNEGRITEDIEEADMFICQYRDGEDYVEASRNGKDVGNLAWLYWMINRNKWTSPLRRMLHYPIPRDGVPGFRNYRISLSNYTGEARTYLSSLIEAPGAKLCRTMTEKDTHLIAAYKHGDKYKAAQEWNINVVNHLWLEESYSICTDLSIAKQKYTYFPPGTNLGEAVGQISLDRKALETFYPKPKKQKAARPQTIVAQEEPVEKATPVPRKVRKAPEVETVRTPAARVSSENDKENHSPPTTGGRGAKARALSKLSDMAPDMALFEKEMKRVGGVVHGRERSKEKEKDEAAPVSKKTKPQNKAGSNNRKRSLEPQSDVEEQATAETPPKRAKNKKESKKAAKGERVYWLMLTKYEGWEAKPAKEANDKMKLRELGIWITDEPRANMLLCAPKLVRTKKFLLALAYAPQVVSSDFLDHALKHHELPEPEDFALHDKENEEKFDMSLEKTLTRAKRNQGMLLKGLAIFCTENVTGGYETMKEIVVANGGTCQLYKGRSNMNVSKREMKLVAGNPESQDQMEVEGEEGKETIYLISNASPKEVPLWQKFRKLAENVDMDPKIVSTEWLFATAFDQRLSNDEKWLLSEEALDIPK